MRKKILIMIFAVSLLSSLQGCNNIPVEENNVPDEENNGIVEEVQTPETVEPVQKTVEEQRLEIKEAMTLAMNTEVKWREIEEFRPTIEEYSYIRAITYDGFEYQGKKTKVFAYLGFPEGTSPDSKVPAIVLIHGGGGHPYLEWVKKWNDAGYAAIAMETTGCFPTEVNACVSESTNALYAYEFTEPFAEEGYTLAPQSVYPTEYTEVKDQWAYHGLSQVIFAHNILRQDERVDIDRIGVTGISWGGTMTAQVIGYDTRFAFAIPIYGTAYLADPVKTFDNFADPYVSALWASENNLDNAKMPILWLVSNTDQYFGVPSASKSYEHTLGLNEKNSLAIIPSWRHSHTHGYEKPHSIAFADWAVNGGNGYLTFETQPQGREVNCKVNIPEGATGIFARVLYVTEPLSYDSPDGSPVQEWKMSAKDVTVDVET
ncbi:MAG: dienelactone hydrolase family protein, partial [Clostridia bacterium]|nr:dienelactone hydrolase family protein [Clostridia bacterium]